MATNFTRASVPPLAHIWMGLGGGMGRDSWIPTHANLCTSLTARTAALRAVIEEHGNIFTPEVDTYQIPRPT